MLEADGLDLERADAVARRDDHVVGAALVPDVAVFVLSRRVFRVEPVAAEVGRRVVRPVPVAERVVRIRARAQADFAPLAARNGLLVLVEDRHLPAGHRLAHRALPHVHERVVADERIRLGQPVVVEHRDAVLLPEPADRFRVQRLSGRADAPEHLRVATSRVLDRHHRAHRRRRREDVRHLVPTEELELPVRIEARLAAIDALGRAEPPRAEQGRNARGPCPLAHAVEYLVLADVVTVNELLVGKDVAVGVQYPLRQPRRPRGVVELRRVVCGRV